MPFVIRMLYHAYAQASHFQVGTDSCHLIILSKGLAMAICSCGFGQNYKHKYCSQTSHPMIFLNLLIKHDAQAMDFKCIYTSMYCFHELSTQKCTTILRAAPFACFSQSVQV